MAYNALASGVLTGKYLNAPAATNDSDRTRALQNAQNPRGRMDEFGWGRTLYRYRTDAVQEAVQEYDKIARQSGIMLTDLCLCWCLQRSLVTTTLVGHSSMLQLQETLKYFSEKGPLSEDVMWKVDRVNMKTYLRARAHARLSLVILLLPIPSILIKLNSKEPSQIII
jgi:aryl-alcohol dehydrogenase-like predicted oxidoreductase